MTTNTVAPTGNDWIEGISQWMNEYVSNDWDPYYLNILFHPLAGSRATLISTMHRSIHKAFYSRFCTRFVRDPKSEAEQDRMPRLMLFPDLPVAKRNGQKHGCDFLTRNDNGLHFNGPMLLPPKSRFRGCPIHHIEANQSKYAYRGIERIHIKPIDYIPGIADYALKTIKKGRASPDDILILPMGLGELPKKLPTLAPIDRAVRDIQSRLNVSDEVAHEFYASQFASS